MEFTWDPLKAVENEKKHGVSFEEATTVWDDDLALTMPDDYPDEDRRITMGVSFEGHLLVVCHADYEFEMIEVVRIISARFATRKEKKDYEG